VGGVVEMAGSPIKLTLAGAVSKGDGVGYSAGWVRANAATGTAIQVRYVAGADGAIGDVIDCYEVAVVKGRFSGATLNGNVYGSKTVAGSFTQTAPAVVGDCNKIVGIAVAADRLHLFPQARADSVA
jgi:hypothetical protein